MANLACDNCNGNSMKLSAAPSWYDNITSELSAGAENLWNDVESAAVWADNTLLGPFSAQSAVAAGQADAQNNGPLTQADNFNPIEYGYNAGAATRGSIASGLSSIGNSIEGAISTPIILIGGLAILFILLDKD